METNNTKTPTEAEATDTMAMEIDSEEPKMQEPAPGQGGIKSFAGVPKEQDPGLHGHGGLKLFRNVPKEQEPSRQTEKVSSDSDDDSSWNGGSESSDDEEEEEEEDRKMPGVKAKSSDEEDNDAGDGGDNQGAIAPVDPGTVAWQQIMTLAGMLLTMQLANDINMHFWTVMTDGSVFPAWATI